MGRVWAIIAIIAMIGFAFVGCDDGGPEDPGGGGETAVGSYQAYAGNPYTSISSSVNYSIVNLTTEGFTNVMKVVKPTQWTVAHYDLIAYKNQEITVTFSAYVKRVGGSGKLLWQINNSDYPAVTENANASAGTWHHMTGTWSGTPIDATPYLYLSSHENNSGSTTYYIRDVIVKFNDDDGGEEPTEGLAFTLLSDGTGYSVSRGAATSTTIVIPTEYNGKPVKTIANNGFYYSNLISIVIPDSVTSIGESAFRFCQSLTQIDIPDSVTSIGVGALRGCNALESITFPINNTLFFGNLFYDDDYDIPNSLKTVTINGNIDIQTYHFNNQLIRSLENVTSIIIGDSVTSIGQEAFSGCTGLTSITIPSSVTSIDSYAFSDCTGLTEIIIPNSVTSIGQSAFQGCIGLKEITIRNSVTSIGQSAFQGCIGLKEITIGNGVTSIAGNAFRNCTGLTSVIIGNSVTSIGSSAFANTGIWNNASNNSVIYIDKWVIGYKGTINSSITIDSDTIGIATEAFSGSTSLTSITIPASVTSIGLVVFSNCINLETITVEAGNTTFRSEGNCLIRISDNVLVAGCKSSAIPNSVTSIGDSAFNGCANLVSITIPNNVKNIGSWAFQNCTSLTQITIPNSVTSIGNYAFSGCTGLNSVTIGSGVSSIGSYAFDGCTGLTSVTFQGTISSANFSSASPFPEDLRSVYFSINWGGTGTYTRPKNGTWTKIN